MLDKACPIEEVDTSNIYSHIFKLSKDGELVAYKYPEGLLIDVSEIDVSFFEEVFTYLYDHKQTYLGCRYYVMGRLR